MAVAARIFAEAGVLRTAEGAVVAAGPYNKVSEPHVEAKKVILKSLASVMN